MKKLINDQMLLTKEAEAEILKKASVLDCECPKHLVEILNKVRSFKEYEQQCINKTDKDRYTHEWLYQASINIDQMISTTIIQLARIEGMIDDNNQIVDHKNKSA